MTRDQELYNRMLHGDLYKPEGEAFRSVYEHAMECQDRFNSSHPQIGNRIRLSFRIGWAMWEKTL